MSRNDISVILETDGPEFRVGVFCADTYDDDLFVCDDCSNGKHDYCFHDYESMVVSREAIAKRFVGCRVFTDKSEAERDALAPGADEYDVPEYGPQFIRFAGKFPVELATSTA